MAYKFLLAYTHVALPPRLGPVHEYMEPVRLMWCVQDNAPPLEPLLSRDRHDLFTTAIIICPDTHPYHATLSEVTDVHIHSLARAPKLTMYPS